MTGTQDCMTGTQEGVGAGMTDGTRNPTLAQQPSKAGPVLLPGMPTLGFGIERYVAEGGAATVISL